jgi:prepilin-type N-terminal cleavage/methylation domain-containing protein
MRTPSDSAKRLFRGGILSRRSAGFSLVELLLAMVVLAIMLLTLISVFIYGYNVIARSKQLAVATQVCQAEVERIRGLSFDSLSGLGSTFTDPKLAGLISGQGFRTVQADAGSDIRKLTVSVAWTFRGVAMRKDVVTFITRNGVDKK